MNWEYVNKWDLLIAEIADIARDRRNLGILALALSLVTAIIARYLFAVAARSPL